MRGDNMIAIALPLSRNVVDDWLTAALGLKGCVGTSVGAGPSPPGTASPLTSVTSPPAPGVNIDQSTFDGSPSIVELSLAATKSQQEPLGFRKRSPGKGDQKGDKGDAEKVLLGRLGCPGLWS